jgi:GntR family transcriptional regulator / MocR family aminotransferase
MDPLFELDLERAKKGSRDASRDLCSQLRRAILEGRLTRGVRLPATRKAGRYFGVARNTAAKVYEQLLSEGFLVARRGSGTFVASRIPSVPRSVARPHSTPAYPLNEFWLRPDVSSAMGFWRDQADGSAPGRAVTRIDFRPGLVDWRRFPFDVYRRVSAQQLRGLERKPPSNKSPQGNQGSYALRAAIAKHIAVTRAVACQPEDIVVTSGAQQAFDLLARILVTPSQTTVAIEDPHYPPMRVAFAAAGAKVTAVGVDSEGLIVDQLPRDARVISICPSHQFPLGVTMSLARRRELLDFAARRGAVVIEDDYDGEFRFAGNPLPALRTSDAANSVFYVGTFSKCMLPALRLGFIVAPTWAMRTLVAAKNCLDWHSPTPIQHAVASFVAEGHLTRHVRTMGKVYGDRRRLLLKLLQESLSDWLTPLPSFYGMHLTALPRRHIDLEAVTQSLGAQGVGIHTLDRYHSKRAPNSGLVLGYGAAESRDIVRGVALLRRALSTKGKGG